MDKCIFCSLANAESRSNKVYENEDFVALLDIHPNTKGMTLVIPKKHYDSYLFNQEDTLMDQIMRISKKVSKKLEKALNVKRVALVFEGMGIGHLHAKLYPIHFRDPNTKFDESTVFFEYYPGYISTQLGKLANKDELDELAEKIKAA